MTETATKIYSDTITGCNRGQESQFDSIFNNMLIQITDVLKQEDTADTEVFKTEIRSLIDFTESNKTKNTLHIYLFHLACNVSLTYSYSSSKIDFAARKSDNYKIYEVTNNDVFVKFVEIVKELI